MHRFWSTGKLRYFVVPPSSTYNLYSWRLQGAVNTCMASRLPWTTPSRASAASCSLVAARSSASAPRRVTILGSTMTATSWYFTIAAAQLQSPATLPLACMRS